MRLFVAVDLSTEIKDKINGLLQKIVKTNADVKWVKPENIHITIKFLGEVEEKKVDIINCKLKETVSFFPVFDVNVRGVGSFPDWKNPRVIWIGIDRGKEELKKLVETTEEIFHKELGFKKEERDFNAHITIARVRSFDNISKLKEVMDASDSEFGRFKVKELILMNSKLTPEGPIYVPISRFSLVSGNNGVRVIFTPV